MATNRQTDTPDMVAFIRPNDHKASDDHPDYWGTLYLEGREFKLAGWKHQGKKGPYLSVKLEEVEADSYTPPAKGKTTSNRRSAHHGKSSDIPF